MPEFDADRLDVADNLRRALVTAGKIPAADCLTAALHHDPDLIGLCFDNAGGDKRMHHDFKALSTLRI